jgi:transcriptional regulator with XRE-family HTH domain
VLREISEEQAAAALCVSVKTYQKWETGQKHRDNHQGVLNLAKTFGVSLSWLIAGIGTP